jgi:hypothetical protein
MGWPVEFDSEAPPHPIPTLSSIFLTPHRAILAENLMITRGALADMLGDAKAGNHWQGEKAMNELPEYTFDYLGGPENCDPLGPN